jgi:thymidylate synthase
MDLQVMRAFQKAVADGAGKEVGEFAYFTSSLHGYVAEEQNLEHLITLFNEEPIWQTSNMN